ncbi:MAG: AMP-binding protein, partial [Alphaproteobacteria bacterium]|nr:AMP-binding protein [Alphaproteobacteria bacterium]
MDKFVYRNSEETSYIVPLTSAQNAIYFAHLLDSSQHAYNISHYREITGKLELELFSLAVDLALAGTPAYRSRVVMQDGIPFLEVTCLPGAAIETIDFSDAQDPECRARAWMDEEWKKPFELTKAPLYRHVLIKLKSDRHILFYLLHHLIVDGAGGALFERNIFETYSALVEGKNPEPPQGADLALEVERSYLSSSKFEDDQKFWSEELVNLHPQESLSGKAPVTTRLFNRSHTVLSDEVVRQLKEFCSRNKIAVARALIAISSLYYARMTGQSDVVIEIPVSLRKTEEDRAAIDMRSSTIFLRLPCDASMGLGGFLELFQKRMRRALHHQRYPREYIQRDFGLDRGVARFQVNVLPDLNIETAPNIQLHTCNISNGPVLDANVKVYVTSDNNTINLELDCNDALYGGSDVDTHLMRLGCFFQAVASSKKEQIVATIPLIIENERTQVVSTFNDTQREIPTTTLPELFSAQVAKTPDAIALIFGDEEVSYRELDARANQLARYLIAENIGPEDIVAIALDRSIEMVVSLLGVLKSGAAYLPLDPEYPVERLAFMLRDSNARRLITTSEIYARITGDGGARDPSLSHNRQVASYTGSDAETALADALLLDDDVLQSELATLSNTPISDR